MNWLDIVFIVLVISCGLVGVWIGLIRAAFGALGVVLGILIASQVSDNLGGLYAGYISNETLANVIAYALIILLSVIVARVLAMVVRKVVYTCFSQTSSAPSRCDLPGLKARRSWWQARRVWLLAANFPAGGSSTWPWTPTTWARKS